jgi:hypothetical protein
LEQKWRGRSHIGRAPKFPPNVAPSPKQRKQNQTGIVLGNKKGILELCNPKPAASLTHHYGSWVEKHYEKLQVSVVLTSNAGQGTPCHMTVVDMAQEGQTRV